MRKQSSSSAPPVVQLFMLLAMIFLAKDGGIVGVAEGGKRSVHIPDELEDVIDDEEDEAWKLWGEKSTPSQDLEFDPPPHTDFTTMDPSQIEAEMMKRHFGPSFGFVKLRLGSGRSPDMVAEIAMKWTKVLKTGSIGANFMAVDINTIMFTMQRGKDTVEVCSMLLKNSELTSKFHFISGSAIGFLVQGLQNVGKNLRLEVERIYTESAGSIRGEDRRSCLSKTWRSSSRGSYREAPYWQK